MISSRLALRPAFFGSHTSTLGPNNAFLIPCVFNSLRIPSPDEDSVHDLRVALRRCRSLASVFEEIDAHPAWRALRKTSKKLFRSLGVIRDAQVQEAWALKQAGADDPLRGQILYALKAG